MIQSSTKQKNPLFCQEILSTHPSLKDRDGLSPQRRCPLGASRHYREGRELSNTNFFRLPAIKNALLRLQCMEPLAQAGIYPDEKVFI
jgi:hypothetical protein